jgi:hypothetical protein
MSHSLVGHFQNNSKFENSNRFTKFYLKIVELHQNMNKVQHLLLVFFFFHSPCPVGVDKSSYVSDDDVARPDVSLDVSDKSNIPAWSMYRTHDMFLRK